MLRPLITPSDILTFWRDAGYERWYGKDDAFDRDLRDRFMTVWEAARDGKLSAWQDSDDGALALVIVLDQFPRNMFRNDPRAFATDALARDVANRPSRKAATCAPMPYCANSFTCPSNIPRPWPIRSAVSRCSDNSTRKG